MTFRGVDERPKESSPVTMHLTWVPPPRAMGGNKTPSLLFSRFLFCSTSRDACLFWRKMERLISPLIFHPSGYLGSHHQFPVVFGLQPLPSQDTLADFLYLHYTCVGRKCGRLLLSRHLPCSKPPPLFPYYPSTRKQWEGASSLQEYVAFIIIGTQFPSHFLSSIHSPTTLTDTVFVFAERYAPLLRSVFFPDGIQFLFISFSVSAEQLIGIFHINPPCLRDALWIC